MLLGAAGLVQFSRNPGRTARRLTGAIAALFVFAFVVWVARGDLFRPSGLESDGGGCGYERAC